MKRTRVLPGYTIVEVLIVLGVTGALFVSAMLMISGQQQRTQFSQNARELESRIQDVMNDVSTGYYTKNGDIECRATGGGPEITDGTSGDTQGQNQACIYIGRVLQFTPTTNYRVHTMVGLRRVLDGVVMREATNIAEAQPRSIAKNGPSDPTPNAFERPTLPGGINVKWLRYSNGTTQVIGSVAFMGELAGLDGDTNLLQSQAGKRVNLVPIIGSSLEGVQAGTADINNMKNNVDSNGNPTDMNPPGGVELCADNGNQHTIITIGGRDRPMGTSFIIGEGSCPSAT